MAEPHRRGGSFRIPIAYSFDRLLEAKLAQAYEILVPCRQRPVGVRGKELNHENGRDLCSGFVRAATRGEHDREPGLRTHRRPQPTGEVHRAREDNSQATGSRAEGHRAVVQTAPSRSCERAAENPERQASRPLPVLRTTLELPGNSAVLSESPAPLERMAEPTDTGTAADLGTVRRNTTSAPAPAASDHTHLAEHRESRLKNPLRETCTLGSVRGEN